MSFAGYSSCRIQFLPNDRSLPSRNYSDRTLVELRQYDFGDYSIRALDIDNKKAEIFNIKIERQDQYKLGESANQPDEISNDAGTFRLWLNDSSRENFHKTLETCFEQIRIHQTLSPSPPSKSSISANRTQQSKTGRKQSPEASRSRSRTREKPKTKAGGGQQSKTGRKQSPEASRSRSRTPEKPKAKAGGGQQSKTGRKQSPEASRSRSRTPEKFRSKAGGCQQSKTGRKQSSEAGRSRSRTPEKPKAKAGGCQQSKTGRKQSPEPSRSRSSSDEEIGSSNTKIQTSTTAKDRNSYASTTAKQSPQRVHQSPKLKQRLNPKDLLVNIYELSKYIREGDIDGATETTQKLANQSVQLQVVPSSEKNDQQKIAIRVKIDSNDENFRDSKEQLTMNVYPSTTIRELRTIFESCDNIPAKDQHFFVNGHLAHDVSTMAELNVQQDTLFVLFAIRK